MENRKRFLLVEDNEDLGEVLDDLVKKQGFEVLYYVSLVDALKQLDIEHNIDLALIDLMDDLSPSVSGVDVAQKVKKNNPDAQIFIMSGLELEAVGIVKRLIERKEVQGFIKKPVGFREIKDLLALAGNKGQ
jgi:CheY-like chemotaxis protein